MRSRREVVIFVIIICSSLLIGNEYMMEGLSCSCWLKGVQSAGNVVQTLGMGSFGLGNWYR